LILAFKYDFIKIVIDLDLLKCYNEEVKNKKRGGSKSKRRGSKSKRRGSKSKRRGSKSK
jgi:hypothetical protein